MSAGVRPAVAADLDEVQNLDGHLSADALADVVAAGRVLVAGSGDAAANEVLGVLRWGLLWDEVPFMHLLRVAEAHRGQGVGRLLVTAWEDAARTAGHRLVLTSTMSSETAQHVFRHLGYVDVGALLLPDEPAELFLRKEL